MYVCRTVQMLLRQCSVVSTLHDVRVRIMGIMQCGCNETLRTQCAVTTILPYRIEGQRRANWFRGVVLKKWTVKRSDSFFWCTVYTNKSLLKCYTLSMIAHGYTRRSDSDSWVNGSFYVSLKPESKTKLNLRNPVWNQTVLMHLDRQLSLIS